MTVTLHFGRVEVEYDDAARWLVTRFEDGTELPAAANHDPASVALAHELGYNGDTFAMSRDHELVHSWTAYHEGHEHWRSATLWLIAHHQPITGCLAELVRWEESKVLAAQRALDKTTSARPWDAHREVT